MAARRTRLTARGIVVLVVLGLVTAGGIAYVGLRLFRSDCTVRVGDHEVSLDRARAEKAAAAVAPVVRRSGTAEDARTAVRRRTDLDGEDAAAVADALTGRAQAALFCRYGGAGDPARDALDASGLTGRAARVRTDVAGAFGDLPLGGFAPGGVTDGHMPGSAHYEGRAIDIFFRPISAANKQHGWAVAQYLVANAERLAINTVIFDDRIWTARRAGKGWRDFHVNTDGKSAATARILEHRDHVHVDVAD